MKASVRQLNILTNELELQGQPVINAAISENFAFYAKVSHALFIHIHQQAHFIVHDLKFIKP